MEKSEALLKTVSVYLIYFLYTYFGSYFIALFPNIDSTIIKFGMDIIFLIFMIFAFRKNLQEDVKNLKDEYPIKRILKVIVLGILASILLNFVLSFIITTFFPNSTLDENTISIQNMATISIVYTIFKTMIFASIAEELLFRESISKVIQNDWILIIVSAVIYTAMNFVFTNTEFSFIQLLAYFCPAILFSIIYIKNNRNILLVMFTKFVYNLIPLTILLVGLFTKTN